MSLSGYRVEALLDAFRKKYGYKRVSDHRIDSLKISEEAKYEGSRLQSFIEYSKPAPAWVTPQNILEMIADHTEYDALVEYEQQRRAGLFVVPTYIPPNPPPPMNLVQEYVVEDESATEIQEGASPAQTSSMSAGRDTTSTAKKPAGLSPQTAGPVVDLKVDDEEDFDLVFEEDEKQDDDADVVYGVGRITDIAMMDFVHKHPDSALKFVASRELDGKHLPSNVMDIYEEWKKRGLSRKKVLNYILQIMEWEALPSDPLYNIWSELRDKIFDHLR
ncbi:MAG: hypothetical protein HQM14_11020 [SAR324 cluster bacterium]|nr:hypothetical protein [SAR324 cluster bacterium]